MDLRREVRHVWDNYDWYQTHFGEPVLWYPFVPFGTNAETSSLLDPVYDEGIGGNGGRRWSTPLLLTSVMVTETEDQRRSIPEARNPIQLTNVIFSMRDLLVANLPEPWEYQEHLNDMFYYQDRFFSVNSYRVRGRAKIEDVIVVVEGIEVEVPEEMVNDPGPVLPPAIDPWPSSFPSI
jgi:hypothetical protein